MSLTKMTGWGFALKAAQKEVAYRSVAGVASGAAATVADITVNKPLIVVYNATDKVHIPLSQCVVAAGTVTITTGSSLVGKTLVIGFSNL